MEIVISVIVWIAIIFFFGMNAQKKVQKTKTLVEGKKPHEFEKAENFSFENLLKQALEYSNTTEGKTQEHSSQEYLHSPYKSQESTEVVYKSQENKVKVKKKEKTKKETHTSLPAIKSTKPPKPEKPKKEEKDEEYKNAVRPPHPLTTFLDNSENVRNAFVLSEILKKKF